MAEKPTFLVVGDFSEEHTDITELCGKFGWVATTVTGFDSDQVADSRNVVAGIVDASFDGGRALRALRRILPEALWIACCRFGSAGERLDLESTGAFHLVHRPFQPSEVLQSLGFVDAVLARRRRPMLLSRIQNGHAAA